MFLFFFFLQEEHDWCNIGVMWMPNGDWHICLFLCVIILIQFAYSFAIFTVVSSTFISCMLGSKEPSRLFCFKFAHSFFRYFSWFSFYGSNIVGYPQQTSYQFWMNQSHMILFLVLGRGVEVWFWVWLWLS